MKRGFRLLPITIFFAVLLLSVKMGGMWNDIAAEKMASANVEVARSLAQLAPAAGDPETPDNATPEAAAADTTPELETAGIAAASATNPVTFNQSEIDLLQALAARRKQLAERERDVESREALLAAAESRIEQKIALLENVKARVAGLLDEQEAVHDKDLLRLVKVYENMKPKAAARIFENLEKSVLLRVAARMKEVKLAAILAQMDPAMVNVVTAELIRRHQMPRPPGPVGGG